MRILKAAAFFLVWNEGQVLPSYGIFQTSWVGLPVIIENKAAKTPRAQFGCLGGAADEVENRPEVTSVVLYFVRVRISPYKPP